ncbi:CRISPR-associated protein Cas4 [delta proteobacterium NaphS2]|nr:CRISPR-associated protein Cas4 [delta proteobacterium NaphS2]
MKKFPESEFIQLSALQHMLFCERQCALIHVEQLWAENRFTAEGRIMHERVDRGDSKDMGRIRVAYSLPLQSRHLGVSGKADVVEFHLSGGKQGKWVPFPVEYKRGKPKKNDSDKVQLCAQALCLEEMLGHPVENGALFYGKTRRRLDVVFDDALRRLTFETARKVHDLIDSGTTPTARYEKKCDTCSMKSLCLPKTSNGKTSVDLYFKKLLE